MKLQFLLALLFFNFGAMSASNKEYDQAHTNLSEYFKKGIDQEKRVKDARTLVLVNAASKLQEGITREQFKVIRNQLSQGLLSNQTNQPILEEMHNIQKNHKRICCCRPWIFQTTINRETESLHLVIDGILKKEHPDTYETLKTGNNRMQLLANDCPVAYSVPLFASTALSSIASAPPLQQNLLSDPQQKRSNS